MPALLLAALAPAFVPINLPRAVLPEGEAMPEFVPTGGMQSILDNSVRWSLPADPASDAGLGGGLGIAFEPSLCGDLLPLIQSDPFRVYATCDALQRTVLRTFQQWTIRSPHLFVRDVTAACIKEGGGALAGNCSMADVVVGGARDILKEEYHVSYDRRVKLAHEQAGEDFLPARVNLELDTNATVGLTDGTTLAASAISRARLDFDVSGRMPHGEAHTLSD